MPCRTRLPVLLALGAIAALLPAVAHGQNFDCIDLNDNNTNLFGPPDACFGAEDPWCNCLTSTFRNPVGGEASGFRQGIMWVSQQPGIGYQRTRIDRGSVDFSGLNVGDVIGSLLGDELIPLGFPFVGGQFFSVDGILRVSEIRADGIEFEAVITSATEGVQTAIFYDPTDEEHSNGHLYTGRITAGEGGSGMVIEYRYATENFNVDPERAPALEEGEVSEPFVTVPVLVEFFTTASGIYTLPPSGAVEVATTIRSFVEGNTDSIPALGVEDPCAELDKLSMCRTFDETFDVRESLDDNNPPVARIDPTDAEVLTALEAPLELDTFCGSARLLARGRNSHDGDAGFQDLSYEWTVSGDGNAVIPAHTRQFKDTHVIFTESGEYEVRLVVDDGVDSAETMIEVLVSDEFDFNAPPNAFIMTSPEPPEVELQGGIASIALDGSTSDTGTDGCDQTLSFRWRTISGPGEVVLTSASEAVTQAQFSFPGFYEIELLIDDGGVFDNEARATVEVEVQGEAPAGLFRRGDSDDSGNLNITDAINTLNWLFLGNTLPPSCRDAADADDNGETNLTDAVYTLTFLVLGGAPPPPPGTVTCGPDPTDDGLTGCVYRSCEG